MPLRSAVCDGQCVYAVTAGQRGLYTALDQGYTHTNTRSLRKYLLSLRALAVEPGSRIDIYYTSMTLGL